MVALPVQHQAVGQLVVEEIAEGLSLQRVEQLPFRGRQRIGPTGARHHWRLDEALRTQILERTISVGRCLPWHRCTPSEMDGPCLG